MMKVMLMISRREDNMPREVAKDDEGGRGDIEKR